MNNYIDSLKKYLLEKNIKKEQVNEIIKDYSEFYEEYFNNGLNNNEIIDILGTPSDVYHSLKGTISKEKRPAYYHKILSVSPFISTIVFVLLGFYLNAWHPSWLVYLSIPFTAVTFNEGRLNKRLTEGLIFIGIVLAFLFSHFKILEWRYAWLFLISFIFPGFFVYSKQSNLKALIPFISMIIAVISYIVLLLLNVSVPIALLSFILPIIISIYLGYIEVDFNLNKGIKRIIIVSSIIISLGVFIALGLTLNNWVYIWQVLLVPIIITIIFESKNGNHVFTSVMPFFATIIFYSLGYFYSLWHVS